MASSTLSRRVSEFAGRGAVRRRAALADLARQLQRRRTRCGSSTPGRTCAPGELRRPHRRVHRRAVVPVARLRRVPDPARAGRDRLALLLVPRRSTRPTRSWSARPCSSAACRRSCRSRSARSTLGGKEFRAGGYIGERLAAFLAEYLNRTGSIILILTLLFLGDHPVDAVLVRPPVRGCRPDAARIAWRRSRRDARAARREAAARSSVRKCSRSISQGRRRTPRDTQGRQRPVLEPAVAAQAVAPAARRQAPEPREAEEAVEDRRDGQRRRRRAEGGRRRKPTPPPPIKRAAADRR